MASRDLTAAFRERRSAAMRKRPMVVGGGGGGGSVSDSSYKKLTAGGTPNDLLLAEEGGLDSNGSGGSIQLTAMGKSSISNSMKKQPAAPAWVNDVNAVEDCLTEIIRQMQQLQSMHAQRVGSVFGKDLENMEIKIETLTRTITDQFRFSERLLQKVGIATRRGGGEEATVGANVQRSLAKRLQEQSVIFRQSQRKYLAEVQAQKSGGLVSGNVNTKFGIDLGMESGDFFTTQQLAVVDDLTAAVQSRDKEIIKIAQSIEELGTIFKELAVLVIDQGTILDRIDYNMEAVVEHTKTGVKQLEKAEKHQKSARPMRCIVCLSITIFFLLLILVLKHSRIHIF